jgi:hypothetical protein
MAVLGGARMARNRIKRQAWKLVRKMRAQAKDRRYEAKTRTIVVRLVSLQTSMPCVSPSRVALSRLDFRMGVSAKAVAAS